MPASPTPRSVGVAVDEAGLQKFHKDFDVDSCPEIPASELPVKPDLEKYQTAKEVIIETPKQ